MYECECMCVCVGGGTCVPQCMWCSEDNLSFCLRLNGPPSMELGNIKGLKGQLWAGDRVTQDRLSPQHLVVGDEP